MSQDEYKMCWSKARVDGLPCICEKQAGHLDGGAEDFHADRDVRWSDDGEAFSQYDGKRVTCEPWAAVAAARQARVMEERRAIDAILREDARRVPAFAAARKAAVVAAADTWERIDAAGIVQRLHGYEKRRGGFTKPTVDANPMHLFDWIEPAIVATYERARGRR